MVQNKAKGLSKFNINRTYQAKNGSSSKCNKKYPKLVLPATFYETCLESSVELTGEKALASIHMFTKQEMIKLIIDFSLPFKYQHLH